MKVLFTNLDLYRSLTKKEKESDVIQLSAIRQQFILIDGDVKFAFCAMSKIDTNTINFLAEKHGLKLHDVSKIKNAASFVEDLFVAGFARKTFQYLNQDGSHADNPEIETTQKFDEYLKNKHQDINQELNKIQIYLDEPLMCDDDPDMVRSLETQKTTLLKDQQVYA